MNKQERNAVKISERYSAMKDDLKLAFRDKRRSSIKNNKLVELIFPKTMHRPSRSDWASQWYFNGFVLGMDGSLLIVDPGVDFYTRFTNEELSVDQIRAIFISHKHIDHCAGLAVILDMVNKLSIKIDLIIPEDCFDEAVSLYLQKTVKQNLNVNLILLNSSQITVSESVSWDKISSMEICKLNHSAELTFGFKLIINKQCVVYVSDTGYSKSIKTTQGVFNPDEVHGNFLNIEEKHAAIQEFVKDADLAIININDLGYNRHSRTHLTGWDVKDMFRDSKLKRLILQHIPEYNALGENFDNNFKLFFQNEKYDCLVPGREITRIPIEG